MTMNSIELKNELTKMCSTQQRYDATFYNAVVKIIMNRYFAIDSYYESDAVNDLRSFFETEVLSLS